MTDLRAALEHVATAKRTRQAERQIVYDRLPEMPFEFADEAAVARWILDVMDLATSDSEEALSGRKQRIDAARVHENDPEARLPGPLVVGEEALSGVARDLDVLRKAVDALETEVRWQLRGSAPGLDPMAGVKRRDLDERFATLRAVLAATEAPAAVAVPLDDIDPERLERAIQAAYDAHDDHKTRHPGHAGECQDDWPTAWRLAPLIAAAYRDAKP